ncbi:izumo sperm-egg fusion protein 1 isoform X2 [Paroedura picta]|uniref:izumo sperm-egg fusion protein 1 isoform X2 n=1 Tax=Paroedura picta TaxID=143630 RepID=UPI004056ECEA
MSWLAFWLPAAILSGCQGCLICSPEAIRVLNQMKGHYLNSKLQGNRELRAKLQNLLQNDIEALSKQPIDKATYMAVIDDITLQQLTSHFKRSMNRIMENQFDVYCSNECGSMDYLLTNCITCRTNVYSCEKKYYCGERKLKVEMDEDLILDCALWWHRYNYGAIQYTFFRIVNGKEQKMTNTLDPFLVKKAANANDTGKYRCKMFGREGTPKSMLDFQVTVVSPLGKTTWFPRPHPTLEGPITLGISSRAPLPQPDWTVWIVIGATGGLLFIIVAALMKRRRRRNRGTTRTKRMTRTKMKVSRHDRRTSGAASAPSLLLSLLPRILPQTHLHLLHCCPTCTFFTQ